MKCLVTGANGFIGSKLVYRLHREGYDVTGLIHNNIDSKYSYIKYVKGDITSLDSLYSIWENYDIVFHCAAFVKDFGRKKNFYEVNVRGVKNLVKLCKEHGIERFIHLGHIPYGKLLPLDYYSETKEIAERFLIREYNSNKFPVAIIRPGNVYGPGGSPWVDKITEKLVNKQIWLIDKGRGIFHYTYIDNLIDALILASRNDKATGEVFDITDGENNITWREYLYLLSDILKCHPPIHDISRNTAIIVSYVSMFLYLLSGIPPIVTPFIVQVLSNRKIISIDKAKDILGYNPKIDFQQGMENTRRWLLDRIESTKK